MGNKKYKTHHHKYISHTNHPPPSMDTNPYTTPLIKCLGIPLYDGALNSYVPCDLNMARQYNETTPQ